MNEAEAKKLLEYYAFPVVKTGVARTPDEAANIAMQIGYPVVLKISPQIIHKTEAGGVILDINSEAELREAFECIMKKAKKYNPNAEIGRHSLTNDKEAGI